MSDFTLSSLRGGMNDTDPPLSLEADQCTSARNVEWVTSMLGERRRGADAIDVAGSALAACNRIVWVHRHLPTTDPSAAQLWAMGITDPSTAVLAYKDTTWHTVAMTDAPTVDGVSEYQMAAVSLHGKLFLAYNSAVDRLHCWDGTTFRRAGLTTPVAAPTASDTGSGSFSGVRYYRTREIEKSGTTILRRSEAGAVLTKTPSGSGTGLVVTKPADGGEGATHWELEASLDNSNFYIIATTVVGTSTATDATAYSDGYASFTLSETSGDYTLIPSVRLLLAVDDRLMTFGSFEDSTVASRVSWTPVYNDTGKGNDERIPIETVSFRDLDTFEGGQISDAMGPIEGEVWIGKRTHIYKLVRTGVRGANAYDVISITKKRGALPGSMVEGVDQQGRPCGYALDPSIGPYRIGADGIQRCGKDLFTTWMTVNLNATKVQSRVVFYETPGQVHWWVPTGSSNIPDTRLVLHVEHTRDRDDGIRRGWAVWDGPSAAAVAVCLYADNIDAGVARTLDLVPFIGREGGIWRTDTGTDDNGTAYASSEQTKPYAPASVINHFGVKAAVLVATPAVGATIDLTAVSDFGVDTSAVKAVSGITLDPAASETQVIKVLDSLSIEELRTVAFTFADPTVPGSARWELNQLVLTDTAGQTA
jgi:hypothetical protein